VAFGLNLYFDFHFPLTLIQLISDLLNNKNFDPKNPAVPIDTSNREWYSQPRPSTDTSTEVVTINYKIPLSISEFAAEFLRESCHIEVWYKDRSNNWRQILDKQRVPLSLDLSRSSARAWYSYHSTVYPIVAKSVQLRLNRTTDPELPSVPYSVGVRNTLIKRNVYDRNQGVQNLEDEQDTIGNVIAKTIKDWDAAKAIDGNTTTFWRSAPMPDPAAVVSLYLDVRNVNAGPQTIDRLYVDPVHTGQHLNLYYTSDDTVGTRKLSPISLQPEVDINTDWRSGRGRWDTRATLASRYAFRAYWGPQDRIPAWAGFEWTPDFPATNGPSVLPVLLRCTPPDQQVAYHPELTYDPGAGQFVLSFLRSGFSPVTFSAGITQTFLADEPLRIVIGWAYNPSRIILQVRNRRNEIIASVISPTSALPTLVSFDGLVEMYGFRGLMTAQVIKFGEAYEGSLENFMVNPIVYVNPDPQLPDALGNIPSSSLDNAVYSADWTQQRFGVGGVDHSEYSEKTWTPIWKNYVSEKGMMFFPQMVTAKYLKMEFTNLTEEPYPIYESGIDVSYKVFPISVQQVATLGPRLFTGSEVGGAGVSLNGVRSVNSLGSILDALGRVISTSYDPVQINTGVGYTTTTVPHSNDPNLSKTTEIELSSNQIYRREVLNPFILAQDQNYTTIKSDGLFKLEPYTSIPWQEIYAANPGAIETRGSAGAIPVRGTNYWIFPGQQLRIPASVMERLTSTSTVTERRLTLETRLRFTTTAVHRYEIRTLRRDAAIAYFAGVREVIPFVSSYIFGQDREVYDFPLYSADQWTYTGIAQMPTGVITWDGTGTQGVASFTFQTGSNFTKLFSEFQDSGLIRSDALWASSSSDQLTPAASIIPANLSGSAWLDSFVDWTDAVISWGASRGVVAVNLDGDRRYQGRRVLRFNRVAGAGEAGIRLRQQTHYIPGGLFRLGCVFYKPFANNNILLIRLVRRSDNLVIYQTPVDAPAGRWVDFTTDLIEVPVNPSLAAPVLTKGATNTSGGTFAAGTYYWKLTAINANGETLGSNEVSATLVLNGTQVLNWTAVPGATGYKLYRGTAAGAENKLTATLGAVTTYTATGGAGTTATLPTANTTADTAMDFNLELVLTGDQEDELYLSDVYSELSHIRYYVRLGDGSQPIQEVTELRYRNSAYVVAQQPVTQGLIQAVILSNEGYAYGMRTTPDYRQ